MSDCVRCCYCSRLPERRPGHGSRVERCPLCKNEVGVAAGGDSFRIAAAPAGSGRRLFGALAIGGVLGASLFATIGYVARPERPTPPVAAASPIVLEVPAPVRHVVIAEAPPNRGESKTRGRMAPIATAKPPLYRSAVKSDGSKLKADRLAAVKVSSESPRRLAKLELEMVDGPDSRPRSLRAFDEATALQAVPEIRLETIKTKAELTKSFGRIVEQHKKGSDAFVDALVKDRPDLEGLPFLKGQACRLASSQLETALGRSSMLIRMSLEPRRLSSSGSGVSIESPDGAGRMVLDRVFDSLMPQKARFSKQSLPSPAPWLPALTQILAAQPADYRTEFVQQLCAFPAGDDAVIAVLARTALFDPDAEVRVAAVKALEREPARKYGPKLLEGFRHPWPPVAEHAADAIIALKCNELFPALVSFLGEPDPGAPFEREENGKKVLAIRELVKINHHRNCMLCHAPAVGEDLRSRTGLVARVPSPDEALPPMSSRIYYEVRDGNVAAIRANETYLRQDFTVMQPVEYSERWPRMQRFDFVVRTRPLRPGEVGERLAAGANGPTSSPNHRAAAYALSRLNWSYFGSNSSNGRDDGARRAER